MKNTQQGINRRLGEVEDWIKDLKDKVQEYTQSQQQKENRI